MACVRALQSGVFLLLFKYSQQIPSKDPEHQPRKVSNKRLEEEHKLYDPEGQQAVSDLGGTERDHDEKRF